MSRSRKKTPIMGITCKESDKPFKVAEHRRARRAERMVRWDAETESFITFDPHKYGNPWAAPKDGKQFIPADLQPKFMRK